VRISKVTLLAILIAAALPAFAQEVKYKPGMETYSWKLATSTGWQSLAPSGTWWRNQSYITSLSLTPEQQRRMDEVFQQSRIKLIDVTAALDKEEAILEPLIEADRLDESKVSLQLDKVADARAELEKATARMLLGIRQVLTTEQWTKLNSSKTGAWYDARKYENAEKLFKPEKIRK
jgi:Spy/CpxP family protein refolding chaperone